MVGEGMKNIAEAQNFTGTEHRISATESDICRTSADACHRKGLSFQNRITFLSLLLYGDGISHMDIKGLCRLGIQKTFIGF